MSGTNPFRRNVTNQTLNDGKSDQRAVPPVDTDLAHKTRAKTSKTVRIISPRSASSDLDDAAFGSGAPAVPLHSPPPRTLSLKEKLEKDESADASTKTSRHYTGQAIEQVTEAGNPFKKQISRDDEAPDRDARASQRDIRPAQFDVNAFKNLLLTGQAPSDSPHSVPPVSFRSTLPLQENESTSSARSPSPLQSIPTPPSDLFDDEISSSSSDEDQDETELHRAATNAPSATGRHHGTPLKEQGPRVVSFEDPALSVSGATSRSLEIPEEDLIPKARQERQRPISGGVSNEHDTMSLAATGKLESQKKVPPTPPPSRRHGQNRPKSFIADQPSSSINENAETAAIPTPISSSKPAPPPPRRYGSMRSDSRSSVPTLASHASSLGSDNPGSGMAQAAAAESPLSNAAKRHSTISPQSGSPSQPPPPPPRRRGSSLSSHNASRLSGDYRNNRAPRTRGDSSASSISQVQIPPSVENAPQQQGLDRQDTLADLSALQREVDEYRERMGQ